MRPHQLPHPRPQPTAGFRRRDGRTQRHLCAYGADDRPALERRYRYLTRPALANERVQTNAAGQVVLKLKTPWRDGTTHLVMSPLEFMQRLAALVPRPRLHLIRFHGVLAPRSQLRNPGGSLLTVPGELGRSLSPQPWAPGPPETSWIAIVKLLAAIDRGLLREAAPGPATPGV